MDLRLSNADRVTSQPKGSRAEAKPAKQRAPAKGTRVEPTLDGHVSAFVGDERSGRQPPPSKRGRAKVKSEKPERKPRRRRSGGGFLMGVFYWGFVLAMWGGLGAIGVITYFVVQMPASNTWAVPDRPPNIRVVADDGQLISNRGKTGGEAVSYRELPYYVPAAFIAAEDRRFLTHFGVDPVGLVAVALESVREGGVTRGASTITQQVAKNLFLSPKQNLERKVQEAVLAVWLEQNYSKEEILELYMNRVYFGSGATGIEAAAQTYFGVSARNLSLGQAAMLAGILPAPSSYNPKTSSEKAIERQRLTLNSMASEGYITRDEAEAARIDPDQTVRTKIAGAESYVADWVESLMQAYVGDIDEDVIVSTTIDWDLQKQAEFIVKEAVATEGKKRGFTQGALVAMDTDGTIRAMVGGVDYQQSQYNRAVTAKRQPGSTFKPFVYLAAMEKGYTPDTVADDSPFSYNGWSPENSSHKYNGPVTLRTGLAYSLNTIAARLAIDVTPQAVVETAMRLGISSDLDPVPSIALGTGEVNLLELTAAYAPFANGGQGIIPNVITKIETASGKILYEAAPGGPGQVIAPKIVAEMNDMLATAVEVGTGKGASLNGWPIAGKTGTSQEARDALFIGFSAKMVTGVWLGNDDNEETTLSGGNVPVQIWSDFMTKAHEGLQVAALPGYDTVQTAEQLVDVNGNAVFRDANGQFVDANGQPVTLDPSAQPFAQAAAGLDPNAGLDPAAAANGGFPGEQEFAAEEDFPIEQDFAAEQGFEDTGGEFAEARGTPVPQDLVGGEDAVDPNGPAPTAQQSRRSQRTLVDMLGNLFGN